MKHSSISANRSLALAMDWVPLLVSAWLAWHTPSTAHRSRAVLQGRVARPEKVIPPPLKRVWIPGMSIKEAGGAGSRPGIAKQRRPCAGIPPG